MFDPKRRVSDGLVSLLASFLMLTFLAGRCLGQAAVGPPQGEVLNVSPPGTVTRDPGTLKPWTGDPVQREIAAGQAHVYEINVVTNQFVRFTVARQGINVSVAMSSPEGRLLAETVSSNDTEGRLQVSVITGVPGAYQLEVRSLERFAAGSYRIELAESRSATTQDITRVEAGNIFNRGEVLFSHATAGSTGGAVNEYERALTLWRKVNDRLQEANTLFRLGQCYSYLAEYEKAIEYYVPALNLLQDASYASERVNVLNSLGSVYSELGESQKALTCFSQALLLSRGAGDKSGVARSLFNMGTLYSSTGGDYKALEYLKEARSTSREANDLSTMIYALQGIGTIYSSADRNSEALEVLQESLALTRKVGDKRGEALGDKGVGNVYAALGETRKALEHYERSLALSRELGTRYDEAETLCEMGLAYAASGEADKALNLFSEALLLSRAVTDRRTEMKALFGIARIDRDQGRLEVSRQHAEAGLLIAESLRTKIGDRELRSSYSALSQAYYEFYLSLLMQLHRQQPSRGFNATAFEVSERARARGLLELLTDPGVKPLDEVDPALLARERSLRQLMAAKTQLQMRLLSQGKAQAQAESVAKEIKALTVEYQTVEAQIRVQSPQYWSLTQPQFLGIKEIQAHVVNEDTLLLEYALCEDRSFLWVVSPYSITSYELPGRASIEAAARNLYKLITSPARPAPNEAKYLEASSELSDMLLGPAYRQLGKKRLVVITQGILQFIPFGVLPVPSELGTKGQRSSIPLIVDHEITYLPSASLTTLLRSEEASRQRPAKTLAVIADPVLSKDDPRVREDSNRSGDGAQSQPLPPVGSVPESASPETVVPADFPRLPYTEWEAEQITALIPPSEIMRAVGFAANRATITSPKLNQYRIIHVATHALINDEQPDLSGILLSSVNEQGHRQDGFLSLGDIFNLKLSADLVVLSACSTGLGKDVKGEGVVGLTRAFMYAGATRVVVSLWNVNDRATADLMARFYRKMFKDNLEPGAALRAAQVEMWRQGRWRPSDWAGFILQGVDRFNN